MGRVGLINGCVRFSLLPVICRPKSPLLCTEVQRKTALPISKYLPIVITTLFNTRTLKFTSRSLGFKWYTCQFTSYSYNRETRQFSTNRSQARNIHYPIKDHEISSLHKYSHSLLPAHPAYPRSRIKCQHKLADEPSGN